MVAWGRELMCCGISFSWSSNQKPNCAQECEGGKKSAIGNEKAVNKLWET